MSDELESINKKITEAEKRYALINNAWLSAKEVTIRIDSLIIIAKELRAAEENLKARNT